MNDFQKQKIFFAHSVNSFIETWGDTVKRFFAVLFAVFILTTSAIAYNGDAYVYITRTGECYHRVGCSYLKSRIEVTLQEAVSGGYRACSRCKPLALEKQTYPSATAPTPYSPLDSEYARNNPMLEGSAYYKGTPLPTPTPKDPRDRDNYDEYFDNNPLLQPWDGTIYRTTNQPQKDEGEYQFALIEPQHEKEESNQEVWKFLGYGTIGLILGLIIKRPKRP